MSQSTDAVFDLRPGASPLVLSLPHVGTVIPEALRFQLRRACARRGSDTDWHLDRLWNSRRRSASPHWCRAIHAM